MVYTVEPQGLLNSGEHAYERLGRVYGDMCANEQMTRMADGLYVLGNSCECTCPSYLFPALLYFCIDKHVLCRHEAKF